MKIPYPPKPPEWYWHLPLVWRQRYCKCFVHPWWHVYYFCEKWVSLKGVKNLHEILSFKAYCLRADCYDAIARKHPKFDAYAFKHPAIWRIFH